jgi:hypothetical protein
MPNRAVSIYAVVKQNGMRSWRAVEIPARQKPLGWGPVPQGRPTWGLLHFVVRGPEEAV